MNTGDIVKFKSDAFPERKNILRWALKAFDKGTWMRVVRGGESSVQVEIMDDEEVKTLAERDIGHSSKITLRADALERVQDAGSLQRLHKEGRVSDQFYLDARSTTG